MATLLVVEDHRSLLASLKTGLEEEGYRVLTATSGVEGLAISKREPLDAVILDLQLPDGDGLHTLQEMRKSGLNMPVMIMSARDGLEDRVLGLDTGADDYLVKPIAFAELLARLRSLLRRNFAADTVLRYETLQMDLLTRRVTRNGQTIELTRREFELVEYFLRHKNEVVTREMLARDVWKASTATWTNVIDVQVKSLRKKIERPEWVKLLHTVRGEGYLLGDEP
jgi:two-component system, OmpR family, copper resistance phosphate regulon response regulator CusR